MYQVLTSPGQLGHLCACERKALARSQASQAALLGVSQSRMSKMELHPETMTLAQVLTLCASLGLELSVAPRPSASRGAMGAKPAMGSLVPPDVPW